ncbi:hypothetical protein M3Y99_00090200 [Aphelenchoides fujianensis]|nr:hypothetical protein M3Y99_00090200 [Aphelenchoides fujianensis]
MHSLLFVLLVGVLALGLAAESSAERASDALRTGERDFFRNRRFGIFSPSDKRAELEFEDPRFMSNAFGKRSAPFGFGGSEILLVGIRQTLGSLGLG